MPRLYRSLLSSGFSVGSFHKSSLDVVDESDVVVLCLGWPSGCGSMFYISGNSPTLHRKPIRFLAFLVSGAYAPVHIE